jgi:hypothetical protein
MRRERASGVSAPVRISHATRQRRPSAPPTTSGGWLAQGKINEGDKPPPYRLIFAVWVLWAAAWILAFCTFWAP